MVPVEARDSAEGFVFEPAVYRFWCGRLGTAVAHDCSLRALTRLVFVPAALIVPFSLKSEAGVLLHP